VQIGEAVLTWNEARITAVIIESRYEADVRTDPTNGNVRLSKPLVISAGVELVGTAGFEPATP
jgi:hypothetical protein